MELDRNSLAAFRILVAVARADGRLDDSEQKVLASALGPHADLLPRLLAEEVDVDEELLLLKDEGRRRVYQSAFALAYADGEASYTEVALLKRILPNEGERSLMGQVMGETFDTLIPGRIVAEADPARRDTEILEDIFKYSVLSAVAGAMPVPGVAIIADLAVIALQVKMVHDIGAHWGHTMDARAARGFIASAAGSAGIRIAVNNLVRIVPGLGSAFGAATSFGTTFAIGKAAQRWFEAGRGLDQSEIRSLFETARKDAGTAYDASTARIDAARKAHGAELAELNEQLASGVLTRADYDQAVLHLGS
jgi:uncharacterized protein (DUF697 family)